MSLVLTELSKAGIAMVTDSAISMLANGKISTVDQQQWRKLIKVPRITAAVSYWGSIGYITKERFDNWLEQQISKGDYADLPSFGDYLAQEMNKACDNKPLPDGQPAGVHVAGFHQWPDGNKRPTFYHIHNGHGHVRLEQKITTLNGQQVPIETNHHYEWDQRKLFSRHNDFPPDNADYGACSNQLNTVGYMTRNGDYAPFIIISGGIAQICNTLNTIPGVSVPRQQDELGPRVGFIKMVMETVIEIYKCSSMSKVIGGTVMTLGIKPDGTYL